MLHRAQASVEYLFVISMAIAMVLIFVWKFFDPRFGTIQKTGALQESVESELSSSLKSKMDTG